MCERKLIDDVELVARGESFCRGCGEDKEVGLVVCWRCFKYSSNPLKYFVGDLNAWLVAIGRSDHLVGGKRDNERETIDYIGELAEIEHLAYLEEHGH